MALLYYSSLGVSTIQPVALMMSPISILHHG